MQLRARTVSLGATADSFPGGIRRGSRLGEGKAAIFRGDPPAAPLVSGPVAVPFLCGSSPFF